MHPDVAALVAVQNDDLAIHALEERAAALLPRVEELAAQRDAARAALEQARQALEAEEKRRRDVHARLDHHRILRERNEAMLNSVTSPREATAATAQLEQAKRMIEEDEREMDRYAAQIAELRADVEARSEAAERLDDEQRQARESMDVDRAALDKEIAAARKERDQRAVKVPRSLLSRYERLWTRKRVQSLFPLRAGSCSNCDTALPVQRRNMMVESGETEICEGCGVLLYAAE